MGKRGNSEGSITKRPDGRWEARISFENGKRKSIYAKTRQEAARLLATAIRDRDKGLPPVGDRQTVEQYLVGWLRTIKPTIRPRTWQRYEQYVRLHTIPSLGRVALTKLTPQQVQQLYTDKLEEGASPTSVKHLHTVIHKALEDALRLGLVQRNVANLVQPPRIQQHEMQVLTPEQVRILLAAALGDRFEALYILAVTTGMRRGELLALKWRDVSLDVTPSIQVRATLQKTRDGFVFTEPKTARSRRKIALTAIAAEALRAHRMRQVEERLAMGAGWEDRDLVFCTHQGRPLIGSNLLNQNFWPLLKRAGLPRIRFHDLRHTAATLLLRNGVHPKVASEMLGHSSVSLTLDVYSHVLPDMQRDATAALDRLLADA